MPSRGDLRAVTRLAIDGAGVVLSALDYGGRRPPAVLLHGLAGHAAEWANTTSWLRGHRRVVAPDLRGHGQSTRFPRTVTSAAFTADVIAVLDALEIERVALVGQSFGAHIAFLVASSHPERVERLVVAEASPSPDPEAEPAVREWLASWPVPFPSERAAVDFFGGDSLRARAWASGLEARSDGLWPRFDADVILRALHEIAPGNWNEWKAIACPTLVVRGEGGLDETEARRMAESLEGALVVTVPDAGHDVHLDQPEEWRRAVEPFLAEA
jgi:pimeloyl-ACP methyl ester carboxylesterase